MQFAGDSLYGLDDRSLLLGCMRGAAVAIGKKRRVTKVTLDSLLFTFATTSPVDTISRSVSKTDNCLSG